MEEDEEMSGSAEPTAAAEIAPPAASVPPAPLQAATTPAPVAPSPESSPPPPPSQAPVAEQELSEAEKEKRAEYLSTWEYLYNLKHGQLTALDKAILGFSTAIPTAVLGIIKALQVKGFSWECAWLFKVGFLCYFFSLLFTVFSFRLSADNIQKLIDTHNARYKNKEEPKDTGDKTQAINKLSLGFFVAGWVWIAIFIALNT